MLVVDDVSSNRLVLRRILEKNNYQVLEACSGGEALQMLKGQRIDIALLDVIMPDADGFSVCRQIRRHTPANELPVLFITAKTEDSDLAEGFLAGGNDYITKPINSIVLLARLRAQAELLRTNRALAETYVQLAQKKRMETVGVFSAAVAHNFNNILGTVLGSAELIEICAEKGSSISQAAELIIAASQRGARLVDSLITFTKPSERSAVVAPLSVINSVLSLVQTVCEPGITFDIRLPESLPALKISDENLAHILIELLKNAIDAVERSGTISLTVVGQGNAATITVCDTGPGIAAGIREHVFEPFYSTKDLDPAGKMSLTGAGLGLCTVYNLLAQAGGSIEIVKSDNSGCTIKVQIPLMEINQPVLLGNEQETMFDRAALLERLSGDDDLLEEILAAYLLDTEQLLTSLRQAVADRDFLIIKKHAHTIKGSSGNIGALRLQSLGLNVEKNAAAQDMTKVVFLIEQMEQEFLRFKNAAIL